MNRANTTTHVIVKHAVFVSFWLVFSVVVFVLSSHVLNSHYRTILVEISVLIGLYASIVSIIACNV